MSRKNAYFSLEIGLESDIPTYSGGLGILAGDTLKSAADLGTNIVGTTLLYNKGYGNQKLDESGYQQEKPVIWDPSSKLKLLPNQVEVKLENWVVKLKAWQHIIKCRSNHEIPIYFLDTNIEGNSDADRKITCQLYGGDDYWRLSQEAVLGIGGVKMLKSLGYDIDTYHLNEGHASLLTLELLKEREWKDENVKKSCVFTTHSPVAGHDTFDYGLVERVLGDALPWHIKEIAGHESFNMTLLAMNLSKYVNAVSKKHAEVTKDLFPQFSTDYITNGVHSFTWTSKNFQKLYDKHIPRWREDLNLLEKVLEIPDSEVWKAHQKSKKELLKKTSGFDPNILTIGFARRPALYKRADLIFSDIDRLLQIGQGKLQLLFAGKAHPDNNKGKKIIQNVIQASKKLEGKIKLDFLENYDMDLGLLLTSGCDIWLNNPKVPLEACGTSGMKSCHNGVPHLSTLDGWWIEGYEEGITGWSIGNDKKSDCKKDAGIIYDKLENKIMPLYYNDNPGWIKLMKNVIALNAPKFNSHRMVKEYVEKAYSKK